jgi:hypothetical protein
VIRLRDSAIAWLMNETQSYKDLLVWQKGREIAKKLYGLTGRFPAEEKFGQIEERRRMLNALRRKLIARKT